MSLEICEVADAEEKMGVPCAEVLDIAKEVVFDGEVCKVSCSVNVGYETAAIYEEMFGELTRKVNFVSYMITCELTEFLILGQVYESSKRWKDEGQRGYVSPVKGLGVSRNAYRVLEILHAHPISRVEQPDEGFLGECACTRCAFYDGVQCVFVQHVNVR